MGASTKLADNEVHFWYAQLSESDPRITALAVCLSAVESKRAERFHFDRDRASYIVSHGLLRHLIAGYVNVMPSDVAYLIGPHGKPSLSPELGDPSLQFNMSHTFGLAVYAFTRNRRIGIDVERVDREIKDRDAIAQGYFAQEEVDVYKSLPEVDKVPGFFNCWTRKESYLKAKGDGLSTALDSFAVTLRPGEPARILSARDDQKENWSMRAHEPLDGYVVAVTAETTWDLVDLGEFHPTLDLSRA